MPLKLHYTHLGLQGKGRRVKNLDVTYKCLSKGTQLCFKYKGCT